MQITHEEARRLIQFNVDGGLNPQEQSMLSIHLRDCFECRAYEDDIHEVEYLLAPLMKRRWSLQPVPLSINAIRAKREKKLQASTVLTIRTALISFVFAVVVFSAWQFLPRGKQTSGQSPVGMPPVPTPSIQSTSTKINFEHCEMLFYTVQANDTLASIADKFMVSEEELVSLNHMKTDTVNTSMTLMVPACHFTPTSAVRPTTSTTFTPVIGSATSSPEPNRY